MASPSAVVKEVVRETLVGTTVEGEPGQPPLSAQSRARFHSHAVKDAETGELYMGHDEFLDAIAPQDQDYHKIKRHQYSILFRVADTKGAGRVSLADWSVFENLLLKPDAAYEIAFRLFDVDGAGHVTYDNFRRLYDLNKGPHDLPFDWDGDWARLYLGGRKRRHDLTYAQFAQMLRGLQGERIRQAFKLLDSDGDGYIDPDGFERIIRETCRHKLSDHVLDNLHTLCNMSTTGGPGGSKISYASVRAFQNMVREVDLVELVVRRAAARSADGRITRA
ncbi:hypothetical protein E4U42_001843, partial [Claviceps africana]